MKRATSPTRRRVWHHYPYVLPADVLSPEPTYETDPSSQREEASKNSLYYLKLTHSFHDGTYLARVAASPDALRSHDYTVMVNDVHLAKARPWHSLLKSA